VCLVTYIYVLATSVYDSSFIYWTDVFLREPEVERATLDGQNRMRISDSYDDNISPNNVVVDMETGDVYWIKYYQREGRADIIRRTSSGDELVNLHGSSEYYLVVPHLQ